MAPRKQTSPKAESVPAPEAAPPVIERRKPDDERKETPLHIRFTEDQKALLKRAAESEGLDLSGWARSTLLKAAKAALPR